MKKELLGSGNYLLDVIMGANIYLVDGDDDASIEKMQQVEAELIAAGKTPYVVPMGASDGIGSLAYAYPTFEANAAVKLVAEKEGILLDPVYTGKAMAGMIEMIKSGKLENPKDIVFLHTGGAPALHPYAGEFLD